MSADLNPPPESSAQPSEQRSEGPQESEPPEQGADGPGADERPDLHIATSVLGDANCTALATTPTSAGDRAELLGSTDWRGLIAREESATVGRLDLGITLQGGDRALTIESIDIEPLTPGPTAALDGALLCGEPQGDTERLELAADLDVPAPFVHTEDEPERPYFDGHVITLAPAEQMSLAMSLRAEEGLREFELVVAYVLEGERAELRVPPPNGEGFAVTGPAGSYGAGYLNTIVGPRELEPAEMCDWAGWQGECR
ncbi:hypothetical protein FH609_014910 [Streptomyces sp. 3MP-14]|uniref:Uncharacterized protein n=1 Tax=Streptomyces mimosae TaxID=2586635 RepID=A0A5N6AD64_9ACTN|nr:MULTISPECIES: hypothetical protein [Streptomyces]KAB8165710.1 hypothetical protein FH607_012235 [Streptomyces mimosae]KAB8176099.1 hypothetical protein FH609_014910 [Streptomyces sp. 3MP-14]